MATSNRLIHSPHAKGVFDNPRDKDPDIKGRTFRSEAYSPYQSSEQVHIVEGANSDESGLIVQLSHIGEDKSDTPDLHDNTIDSHRELSQTYSAMICEPPFDFDWEDAVLLRSRKDGDDEIAIIRLRNKSTGRLEEHEIPLKQTRWIGDDFKSFRANEKVSAQISSGISDHRQKTVIGHLKGSISHDGIESALVEYSHKGLIHCEIVPWQNVSKYETTDQNIAAEIHESLEARKVRLQTFITQPNASSVILQSDKQDEILALKQEYEKRGHSVYLVYDYNKTTRDKKQLESVLDDPNGIVLIDWSSISRGDSASKLNTLMEDQRSMLGMDISPETKTVHLLPKNGGQALLPEDVKDRFAMIGEVYQLSYSNPPDVNQDDEETVIIDYDITDPSEVAILFSDERLKGMLINRLGQDKEIVVRLYLANQEGCETALAEKNCAIG